MDAKTTRILVCMTGTSPQVVTETLYALAHRSEPFLPDRLVLISTLDGAELARKTLLDPETGQIFRLAREISLPLTPETVSLVCLKARNGTPLPDIRTIEENEDGADGILGTIRDLATDPNTEIHVSLSGGRKTMGFYAGYALSLYGRPGDSLSHVLVGPPFDYLPDFFYPASRPGVTLIPLKNGELADSYEARLTLAEIPVVRLRPFLPDSFLSNKGSFTDSVRAAQKALLPPFMTIDVPGRKIEAHGIILSLPPAQMAMLVWLAEARFLRNESVTCPKERPANKGYAATYLDAYNRVKGSLGGVERTAERLAAGMDKSFFEETLSKLNRSLRDLLGEEIFPHYQIERIGSRYKSYRFPLSSRSVRFASLTGASLPEESPSGDVSP